MKLTEEINRIKEVMFESLQGENKTDYFKDEMDEIERAAQDLSRDNKFETSVKDILKVLNKAKETKLDDKAWKKLENTESNEIKKGDMDKVVDLAKKYNKSSPLKLKDALLNGEYRPPLILKFGDRYHLVAGNTRLCTAASLGLNPNVIIGDLS
jgi:ParB-like chromosome segregation protein Spo0J